MAEEQVFQNGDRLDIHPGFSYLGTHDGHLIVASAGGTTYYSPHGTQSWDAAGHAILPQHMRLANAAADEARRDLADSDWAGGYGSDAAIGTLAPVEPLMEQQGSTN